MAAIKSYSDLQQSKKLAEILPLESADMGYLWNGTSFCEHPVSNQTIFNRIENIPCWSLAALLSVLPTMIGGEFDEILQLKMDKHLIGFHLWYISLDTDKVKEGLNIVELNPVDACVAMIEKLNELKML